MYAVEGSSSICSRAQNRFMMLFFLSPYENPVSLAPRLPSSFTAWRPAFSTMYFLSTLVPNLTSME